VHDDSIQAMVAVGMRLEVLRRGAPDPESAAELARVERLVESTVERLRHLTFELNPPTLETQGLAAAVGELLRRTADRSGLHAELRNRLATEPTDEARRAAFRIVQEALANVRRHAMARSVVVTLNESEDGWALSVIDDGHGFEPGREDPTHMGLASMRQRAELLGGRCSILTEPGDGTRVDLWLPRA
jgi:signal transduction histidine kinase